jgi:hypothetical protein
MYKFLFVLSLTAFAAAFAAPSCPNDESYFLGRGDGVSMEDAKDNANLAISKSIFSSVSSVTHKILQKIETDDDYNETNLRIRFATLETDFRNVQDVKDLEFSSETTEDANGVITEKYVSVRYICRSDAAKPWLAAFDAGVAKYSNLAIKIAEEKDSQKRNEYLSTAASVKDSANWADIVLSSIMQGSTNKEYAKLKEEFKEAKNKIKFATQKVHDKHYNVFVLPLLPPGGWAQLYKGHYVRAAAILGSEAVLLGICGIALVNAKETDRKYKDAVLKYNGSKNLNEKSEWLQKSKDYKSDRESAENTVYVTFVLAGVVYIYNIVDGYATTPALARWHWVAMPAPSQRGMGAAFALTGNF